MSEGSEGGHGSEGEADETPELLYVQYSLDEMYGVVVPSAYCTRRNSLHSHAVR